MKIALAQIQPHQGKISQNSHIHQKFIRLAITQKVDLIAFPELSLTGYEPKLAHQLSQDIESNIFDIFGQMSHQYSITITLGCPLKIPENPTKPQIGMLIFQPDKARKSYAKQILHSDEIPYFVAGKTSTYFFVQTKKITPAICYESLIQKHAQNAFENGTRIYLASVAKSENGLQRAMQHYSKIAQKYKFMVVMVNNVGHYSDFKSAGKTAIWDQTGNLITQLHNTEELLIFDTQTRKTLIKTR